METQDMAADISLPRIYLASTSPRRRELLHQIGVPHVEERLLAAIEGELAHVPGSDPA